MDLFNDKIKIADFQMATRLFKESQAGFLTLFNDSPVCMSMTSPQRVYAKVNRKFLERFGYNEAEVIGKNSVQVGILDKDESLRVGSLLQEKGRLQNDYVKCITKSGEIVHTVSSIEKMEMDGEIYLVSFFIDISKIIEQQNIIEMHMRQLEALNKELESFSYSVSHDLRAPLRAIDGYIKMLEEDYNPVLDEDGKRMLGVVQKNARKMGNLIDDLLSFARLGKKPIQKSEIDMKALITDVLNELKNTTGHKALIKTGTLHPVKGDLALIRQVLVNLMANGVKYSSKKPDPVVEITSEIKDRQVLYTIKDNGEGFDMKYADKLFGVFQRLHSAEEFEGTGVGLATVKRILARHGGDISAEAERGKGAAFTFSLPFDV